MARPDHKTMVYFPVGAGIMCVICLFTVAVPVKGRNMMRCSNCMRSIYVPPINVRCLLYIVCQKQIRFQEDINDEMSSKKAS